MRLELLCHVKSNQLHWSRRAVDKLSCKYILQIVHFNIHKYQKLLEIEKEIVREVARCDKPYLRKSSDRKAQISPLNWTNAFLICALRCRFSHVMFITPSHLTHNLGRHFLAMESVNWPTLAWRRRRQKLLLLWDLLQGSGPPNLRDQVFPASTRTQYCLRNPLSLAAPHCRTVHRRKSFLPSTVTPFNSLPPSAVSCSSKSSFKHAIDLHFVEDKFSFGLL